MRALLIIPLLVVGCRSHPVPVSQADVALGSSGSFVVAVEGSARTRLVIHVAHRSGREAEASIEEVRLVCGGESFPVESSQFPFDLRLPGVFNVDLGGLASRAESQPSSKLRLLFSMDSKREAVLVDLGPLSRRTE